MQGVFFQATNVTSSFLLLVAMHLLLIPMPLVTYVRSFLLLPKESPISMVGNDHCTPLSPSLALSLEHMQRMQTCALP